MIDTLEKQRSDDKKWFLNNAQRIDKMEGQVREQTKEAMEYSRAKCATADALVARFRADFHNFASKVSPDLQGELDTIQAGIIDGSIPVKSYLG